MTAAKHTWLFKARFRTGAYGWKASGLACQRLKEAVTEIKSVARRDALTAGEGVVALLERIWPALEHVDSSSGALGSAVNWTQDELLPLIIAAPAGPKIRERWLERLWQAVQDDGVEYLGIVEEQWGPLCGSPEVASQWADKFIGSLRAAWTDPRRSAYLRGGSLCLSSLLAAGRHQELWELLDMARFSFWYDRKFGVQALLKEGRVDEALTFAEASRGLNQPNSSIDAACEQILLEAGRVEEAYLRYGLTATARPTGLATFRAIAKKYPSRDARQILLDLAAAGGKLGYWFASAKDAGFLDLALDFARMGQTDPRTLSRAARDLLERDAPFALAVGRLALERMVEGSAYDLADSDVLDACDRFLRAAERLGVADQARAEIRTLAGGAGAQATLIKAWLNHRVAQDEKSSG